MYAIRSYYAFLKDADIYDKLSGTGNLTLDLRARGFDADAIMNTLSGKTVLAVTNGKIEGVNLQKLVNDARTKYNQLRGNVITSYSIHYTKLYESAPAGRYLRDGASALVPGAWGAA